MFFEIKNIMKIIYNESQIESGERVGAYGYNEYQISSQINPF